MTAPQYHEDQPSFLNAIARIEAEEHPEKILSLLREMEQKLGKAPPFRFGPRTIDLDLLMYDDLVLPSPEEWRTVQEWHALAKGDIQKTPAHRSLGEGGSKPANLILPHPRMHERRFVLEPLSELVNTKEHHPVLGESWENLLQKTLDQACDRMLFSL